MTIPVLGIAGFSGSGKTTLIEKLIPVLRGMGLRVAILKHDGHRFDLDRPGKDSARFSAAGAEMVVLTSKEKSAVIEQRSLSLEESLRFLHDVDLVLVEGYKNASITQIGIARQVCGKGFTAAPSSFWCIVTDIPMPENGISLFQLSDVIPLAKAILAQKDNFTVFDTERQILIPPPVQQDL